MRKREVFLAVMLASLVTYLPLAIANSPLKDEPMIGQAVEMFTVEDIAGNRVSLAELLKKYNAVVLNFWGARCGACIEEIPHMNALQIRYPDRIVVLGVNVDAVDAAFLREQMEKAKLTFEYPVVPDPDFRLVDQFKMTAAPLTIVIDSGGIVRYRHDNYLPGDEKIIEEVVRGVIGDTLGRGK